MPTTFIMPKMDMDQETVHINEWLKKEGDIVQKGEPVIVIETDKITSEVEAPETGKLVGIKYGENVDVPVTKVVAYILGEGETEADLPKGPEPDTEKGVKQEESSTLPVEKHEKPATSVAKRMAESEGIDLSQVPTSGEKVTKEDVEAYLASEKNIKPRVETPATPAARRIASTNDIDLANIQGSGPRGRVQAADVENVQTSQEVYIHFPYACRR